MLAHNNKSQICYCGQISLQSAAVNCQTPLGVTFILLAMVLPKGHNRHAQTTPRLTNFAECDPVDPLQAPSTEGEAHRRPHDGVGARDGEREERCHQVPDGGPACQENDRKKVREA